MIRREDTERLLALHTRAYGLLLWLGEQAAKEPRWLAPGVVARLAKPATSVGWLEQNRGEIPSELLPSGPIGDDFAALFSSFFDTSFRVDHLDFEGVLLDSALKLGAEDPSPGGRGMEHSQALALKHLAAFEKMFLAQDDARRLVKRRNLRAASLIWTYAWELDRRARGKGKGPLVRKIWRAIPLEIRKTLSAEVVWGARLELLEAARALVAAPGADPA